MASNKKKNDSKVWRKNIKKLRNSRSQLLHRLFVLGVPENSPKNVSGSETCGVTKYRHHCAVSILYFSKKFKKVAPQNHKKSFMEMENKK